MPEKTTKSVKSQNKAMLSSQVDKLAYLFSRSFQFIKSILFHIYNMIEWGAIWL